MRSNFASSAWAAHSNQVVRELRMSNQAAKYLISHDNPAPRGDLFRAGMIRGVYPRDGLEPADHGLGRSRGGWGSKLHLVTDGHGLILTATLTAGQTHEATQLCQVMHSVRRPRRIGWPRKIAGDKGYSYETLREFLCGCGVEPVIPRRSNQPRPRGERFDKRTYRKRCRVEQAVGWLKQCRRLGTRYEKLALNFLAFVQLGIMLQYLRILDPSDRASWV